MTIFCDEADYRQFLRLLGRIVESHDIECWNYVAMPNHYHATLRTTRPNLSQAIQELNGEYGQWWNKRHARVGHVFQGRFKDQIVQREGYLLTLCRYVPMNPVRGRLVERPESWEWSSYAATIGLRPAPSFLAVDLVLSLFGDANRQVLQERFAAHVMGPTLTELCTDDEIRSNQQILGDLHFKRALLG